MQRWQTLAGWWGGGLRRRGGFGLSLPFLSPDGGDGLGSFENVSMRRLCLARPRPPAFCGTSWAIEIVRMSSSGSREFVRLAGNFVDLRGFHLRNRLGSGDREGPPPIRVVWTSTFPGSPRNFGIKFPGPLSGLRGHPCFRAIRRSVPGAIHCSMGCVGA